MKSQKLSTDKRDAIALKLLDKKFADIEAEIQKKKYAFNLEIYNSIYDEATRRKMNRLPKGWLPEKDEFAVYFEGGAYGGRCRPDLEKPKRFLHKHESLYVPIKAFDSSTEIHKKHEDISKEIEDSREERKKMNREVWAILNSANTTKQLIELWPEIEDIVKELFDNEASVSGYNLPAVNMADINKKLGLVA